MPLTTIYSKSEYLRVTGLTADQHPCSAVCYSRCITSQVYDARHMHGGDGVSSGSLVEVDGCSSDSISCHTRQTRAVPGGRAAGCCGPFGQSSRTKRQPFPPQTSSVWPADLLIRQCLTHRSVSAADFGSTPAFITTSIITRVTRSRDHILTASPPAGLHADSQPPV